MEALPILLFLLGLAVGSFIANYTYRLPKGIGIVHGRSVCDHCGYQLSWFDNIPALSYLLLLGRCRSCGKKISIRYPMIELATGILFGLAGLVLRLRSGPSGEFGWWYFPIVLLTVSIMIAIFIIDFEYMVIPDNLINIIIVITFITIILGSTAVDPYDYLFSGFLLATFLLSLNLITKGKGMGLGDVKLALAGGLILGLKYGIIWMSLSFVIGAVIGVILILLKKAEFGRKIAFGPFLVVAFFIVYFWGDKISGMLSLGF